jgi:hypothetical protein
MRDRPYGNATGDMMMRAVETLPPEFERFRHIGGALRFAIYEDARGGDAEALTAITSAVPDLDRGKLESLGCRRIDRLRFFGDWYDMATDSVLSVGEFTTSDGKKLVNPRLKDLGGIKIQSGGSPLPEAGDGGQFAYAFSFTPYGLDASPEEVQELFDAITKFILPPNHEHHILDWSSPRLPEASKFFAAGMEWWGVFLFTIHVPLMRRLTVVAGSTSD